MNQSNSSFKQVSLPVDLLQEITAAAQADDRSVPKQIEHWVRLAQTIEQILPPKTVSDIKQNKKPAPTLLEGLAAVLLNPAAHDHTPTKNTPAQPTQNTFKATLIDAFAQASVMRVNGNDVTSCYGSGETTIFEMGASWKSHTTAEGQGSVFTFVEGKTSFNDTDGNKCIVEVLKLTSVTGLE